MSKVRVISSYNSLVSVFAPSIPFRHEWIAEGAHYDIEKETLEQLMFDPGFKYMIDTGILYIEDMDTKKELGIEPEDATEPVNVIVLTDKDRRRYLVNMSQAEFEQGLESLSQEQIRMLAEYAVTNRLIDYEKAKVLKAKCGLDIITAIRLGDEAKEG